MALFGFPPPPSFLKIDPLSPFFSFFSPFQTPSILLLAGPAGSGKTATLEVLARELRIDVVEWINPVDLVYQRISPQAHELQKDFEDYVPKMQKFIRFVSKASRFSSLRLGSEEDGGPELSKNPRKVLLVEDFPNVIHYDTRMQFQACIRDYLASTSPSVPLVFIVSDGNLAFHFFKVSI